MDCRRVGKPVRIFTFITVNQDGKRLLEHCLKIGPMQKSINQDGHGASDGVPIVKAGGTAMSRQRSMEKIQSSEYVSIGELARLTGCRYSTLKFYTEEGMLPFEQAEENLTRRFPRERAIARLEEIQGMKAQGLSIPDIKGALGVAKNE